MRNAIIDLFHVLDTKINERSPYLLDELKDFPYVNGGLFAKEDIEIPNFTQEIKDLLIINGSENFDWSEISPTIFGAVFESTLNSKIRREGGMHYTTIENIHKPNQNAQEAKSTFQSHTQQNCGSNSCPVQRFAGRLRQRYLCWRKFVEPRAQRRRWRKALRRV